MANQLAVRSAFDLELTSENLENLASWVAEIATPENLAWESDKFRDLRNLLRTRKAAANLRIQAVKIECIALRRIGLAGLGAKLDTANRRIAKHFSEMSNEDFDALMRDCNNQHSPQSFLRSIDEEWEQRQRHYAGRVYWEQEPNAQIDLRFEFRELLKAISVEGPFTVAEAAEVLFENLEETYNTFDRSLPREFADEPLREVVRAVLRSPVPGSDVIIDDTCVTVPEFVTYETTNGWFRVSWNRALLADFRNMVQHRMKQAEAIFRKASDLALLLSKLDDVLADDSLPVDQGLIELFKGGIAKKGEEQND